MTPTTKIIQDIKSIIDLDLAADWDVFDAAITAYLTSHGYTLDEHYDTDGLCARTVSLKTIEDWLFDNATREGDVDREQLIKEGIESDDQLQQDYESCFKDGIY